MAPPVGFLTGSKTPKITRAAAAWLAVVAAILTIALKFGAYQVTGSSGLLSDAVESIANLVTSVTALITIWYASKPADRTHNYGHGKAEFIATGIEGVFIIGAAVGIMWIGILHLIQPAELAAIGAGSLIALGASAINLAVGRVLVGVGKAQKSPALIADGQHVLTDVLTSVGVVVGLGVVWITGYAWIDGLVAIAVAVNILRTGGKLIRQTVDGFMDRALSPTEVLKIRAVIEGELREHALRGIGYHALRTREAGRDRFVDFHLLVPGGISVQEAHVLADQLEQSLDAKLDGVSATIHVEPIESESDPWFETEDRPRANER